MNTDDYLTNLDKWQAQSHPGLANRRPEDLFEAGFVERYRCLHGDLWWRLVRVHGTLHSINQLEEFPFDYLYGPDEMAFWRLVVENFLDIACLVLHGLVSDAGGEAHTIRSFCRDIYLGPWLCPKDRELFRQTLRDRRFDNVAISIAGRLKEIRDRRIAHRLIDRQSASLREASADVTLEELWRLFHAAHSLFGSLSFGSAYATLAGDLIPSMVNGQPARTCLDGVLDAVLRDSFFVNMPERRGKWWAQTRTHMSPGELQLMNALRRRVGLADA